MPHGCQQNLLHLDKDTQAILEYLCSESNKLHNCTGHQASELNADCIGLVMAGKSMRIAMALPI